MTRKGLSTILLLTGSAVLVWCATVWTSATLFEKYEEWRWSAGRLGTVPVAAGSATETGNRGGVASAKPHDVIAWLDVPRLGISTAVFEGDDAVALTLGAGHIPGTSFPGGAGNVGIAAHRDTFFRSLGGIGRKDRIRLRTRAGEWEYTVESTRIVRPSNVGVLAGSEKSELTLVTCYPFRYVGAAPLRFVVRARRVGDDRGRS